MYNYLLESSSANCLGGNDAVGQILRHFLNISLTHMSCSQLYWAGIRALSVTKQQKALPSIERMLVGSSDDHWIKAKLQQKNIS